MLGTHQRLLVRLNVFPSEDWRFQMGHLRRSFDWLVVHEKLVVLATSVLIVTLALQIRFCGRDVHSDVAQPQTATNSTATNSTATNSTATKETPRGRLTGTWEMLVQKRKGGVQNWILTLTQDGEKLSGIITSEGGDLEVSGTIKGDAVNLSAKKFGVTVEFPATVEGEAMTGMMKALMVRRQWTARRK